jgi:hypothetical protein
MSPEQSILLAEHKPLTFSTMQAGKRPIEMMAQEDID